jgi:hypothetical protein
MQIYEQETVGHRTVTLVTILAHIRSSERFTLAGLGGLVHSNGYTRRAE